MALTPVRKPRARKFECRYSRLWSSAPIFPIARSTARVPILPAWCGVRDASRHLRENNLATQRPNTTLISGLLASWNLVSCRCFQTMSPSCHLGLDSCCHASCSLSVICAFYIRLEKHTHNRNILHLHCTRKTSAHDDRSCLTPSSVGSGSGFYVVPRSILGPADTRLRRRLEDRVSKGTFCGSSPGFLPKP